MKNYRNLVAVSLVLMMGLSIYTLINNKLERTAQLTALQQEATELAEKGLLDKAAKKYHELIIIENKIDYYIAIADLYADGSHQDAYVDACEEVLLQYPDDPRSYVYMLDAYTAEDDFSKAYQVLKDFDGRKLKSDDVEKIRDDIQYRFYIESVGADEVRNPSGKYGAIKMGQKWGFVSMQGKSVTPAVYERVGDFANGVAPVLSDDGNWYQIDTDGILLQNISSYFDQMVEDVGIFNDGLMPIAVDGTYSYYNEKFEKLDGDYEFAGGFNYGVAAVRNGNMWSLVNSSGQVIQDGFEDIILDQRGISCIQDRVVVKKDGRYFLVDSSGKQIGNQTFDDMKSISSGDMVAVKSGDLWGYVNMEGEMVIEPSYVDALSFSNGLAGVFIDGLWGYISPENKLVIPGEYQSCSHMSSDGTAFVKTEKNWKMLKLYSSNY